jgi:hypothetical protein
MEFTDLFIALAREKGIYAREINGYGFSDDPNLRPLSLISDLLHSWPEYFDEKNSLWRPVDPTWENTSGIDYFHSLDLNHIVFAIHGKNPILPLSAGMYKIENSKDVSIKIAHTLPKEQVEINLNENIKPQIIDKNRYKAKITLTNDSNVFLKNSFLKIQSPSLKVSPDKIKIDVLAPYQIYDYEVSYESSVKNINKKDLISISFDDTPLKTKYISIISFYWDLFYKSLGVVIGFSFLLVIYKKLR